MSGNFSNEDDKPASGCFASPPCFMHELDPSYSEEPADRQQAIDVARWRKSERQRLIAARLAIPADQRFEHGRKIALGLDAIITFTPTAIVAAYWPIRGEPDLRPWMTAACMRGGVRVALPAVTGEGQPLIFREWHTGARLERGYGNIPFPAAGAVVVPTIIVAPCVGFDRQGFRLGYGGGFLDRSLRKLHPKPLTIGVGYPAGLIPAIFPQPHDVPMDWIVTGSGSFMKSPGL